MCVAEIWTYEECCCQYLHPLPCYDRKLQSLDRSCHQSVNAVSPSGSSSSSLSSIVSRPMCHNGKDFTSKSSPRVDSSDFEDETDAACNHRLDLVRTCSLRQKVKKTFLEPICDDCLLLEIGPPAEAGFISARQDDTGPEDGTLDGAQWLLESSVEIIIEPPTNGNGAFHLRPKPRVLGSSSEDQSDTESPRRGGRRRRAMDISRESFAISEGPSLRRRTSFQRLNPTGRHLRRARKQHDLKSSLHARSGISQLSSARPSSWIEHLRTDLGQKVRKKRHDVSELAKIQRTESSNDASSGATEEDRILSLPSIPATASSTISTASVDFKESVMLPLDQLISSSEFDSSSYLSDHHPPPPSEANQQSLQPTAESAARTSNSTERSVKSSHHTATASTPSPCSSPVATTAEGGIGLLSLHPLSCPLLVAKTVEDTSLLVRTTWNKSDDGDGDIRSSCTEEDKSGN